MAIRNTKIKLSIANKQNPYNQIKIFPIKKNTAAFHKPLSEETNSVQLNTFRTKKKTFLTEKSWIWASEIQIPPDLAQEPKFHKVANQTFHQINIYKPKSNKINA